MNATNFDHDGLIIASEKARGALDGIPFLLYSNRDGRTSAKRVDKPLHSLKLEHQIRGSLITVGHPEHKTPVLKPVRQLTPIPAVRPRKGHLILGVDVSSHCDV